MGRELEIIVATAVDVRDLKRGITSSYNGVRSQLDGLETDMTGRLKAREKLPKGSVYVAELVVGERGGNGISYKRVIDDFCAQFPQHREFFEQLATAQRAEAVERLNYMRAE